VVDGSRELVDEGDLHSLSVSPDGRWLAYFKASPEVPRMAADRPPPGMWDWAEFHLCVAGPDTPPRSLAAVRHAEIGTLVWSPGGRSLALLHRPGIAAGVDKPPHVLRVRVAEGAVEALAREDLAIRH